MMIAASRNTTAARGISRAKNTNGSKPLPLTRSARAMYRVSHFAKMHDMHVEEASILYLPG